MISSFAIELIEGIVKKVQYITYSNGRRVKRVYDNAGTVPETVEILDQKKSIDTLGYYDRFNSIS